MLGDRREVPDTDFSSGHSPACRGGPLATAVSWLFRIFVVAGLQTGSFSLSTVNCQLWAPSAFNPFFSSHSSLATSHFLGSSASHQLQ